jgi:hypothetical protein
MNKLCQILPVFALTAGVIVAVPECGTLWAQVPDVDLLQTMLPGRPTPPIPNGGGGPTPPTPTTSLGVLPGGMITPLPDPGLDIVPPMPPPVAHGGWYRSGLD